MVSLDGVFWMFVILFGIIGGFRGWAKEMLVVFSMVLALFIQVIVQTYVPGVSAAFGTQTGMMQFVVKGGLFVALAFFGYQTPNLPRFAGGKFARERLQDWMLGFILGMLNGYLLLGSLWFFMDQAGYPFPQISRPPDGARALTYLAYLPPKLLGIPYIYFAVGAAFVFVIIVFV